MFNQPNKEEVVKCAVCDKYFGYIEKKDKKCRLCGVPIDEALKGTKNAVKVEVKDEKEDKKEKSKDKKGSPDDWTGSFKVWK